MGARDNGLTLQSLAQRLEALERENSELRHEVSALKGSGTRRNELAEFRGPDTPDRDEETASEPSETVGQVSRRALLSKAGAAAVAAMAAGTLLNIREAKAHALDAPITPSNIQTHWIWATNHVDASPALQGSATTTGEWAEWGAVDGKNFGSGPGVRGTSESAAVEGIATGLSGTGVEGKAEGSNGTGVKGSGRYGVWGESNQAGFFGVTGRNTGTDGTGVRGIGAGRGVKGESTSGIGVHGHGPNGVYGTSGTAGSGAVYGLHQGDGHGVVGDASSTTKNGVLGRNPNGVGVQGEGKNGVVGLSSTSSWSAVRGANNAENGVGILGQAANGYGVQGYGHHAGVYGRSSSAGKSAVWGDHNGGGNGVRGYSTRGIGGLFQGGRAQLRLVPKGTAGPSTGAHTKGEIYMDKAGALFVCVAGGNPATWRKVSTTAV